MRPLAQTPEDVIPAPVSAEMITGHPTTAGLVSSAPGPSAALYDLMIKRPGLSINVRGSDIICPGLLTPPPTPTPLPVPAKKAKRSKNVPLCYIHIYYGKC